MWPNSSLKTTSNLPLWKLLMQRLTTEAPLIYNMKYKTAIKAIWVNHGQSWKFLHGEHLQINGSRFWIISSQLDFKSQFCYKTGPWGKWSYKLIIYSRWERSLANGSSYRQKLQFNSVQFNSLLLQSETHHTVYKKSRNTDKIQKELKGITKIASRWNYIVHPVTVTICLHLVVAIKRNLATFLDNEDYPHCDLLSTSGDWMKWVEA